MSRNCSVTGVALASIVLASVAVGQQTLPASATDHVAALERRIADLNKEIGAAEQQKAERLKVLQEQKPVADLKKAFDDAEAAFQAFMKTEKPAKIVEARDKANAVVRSTLEDLKKADAEYPGLRTKISDARARRSAVGTTPEAAAEIDKEIAGYENQKTERRKVLSEMPAMVAAKKAADDAEAAFKEFVTNDPDYGKLKNAYDESRMRSTSQLEAAKAGDADYSALRAKMEDLRKQRAQISQQIATAKAAK